MNFIGSEGREQGGNHRLNQLIGTLFADKQNIFRILDFLRISPLQR
jgi:hypothetical protein